MTDQEFKYIEISASRNKFYDKSRDRLMKILLAKGVTTEMWSDLIKFEKEKGKTEKSKAQMQRLIILEESLDVFDTCAGEADQLDVYMRFKDREIAQLKKRIEALEYELKTTKQFYEGQESI